MSRKSKLGDRSNLLKSKGFLSRALSRKRSRKLLSNREEERERSLSYPSSSKRFQGWSRRIRKLEPQMRI
jgi:hypothetical protein